MKILPSHARTLLFAAALLFAGCAVTPSARFYTLTPLEPRDAKAVSRETAAPPSLTIAPVEIPDYLDRPQMVTRDGRNEVNLAEFDRWAGSLRENMADVLAENLSLLLGSDRVFVYPRVRAEKSDYLLKFRVLRLDCAPGDRVLLKAQWTVFSGPDQAGVTHLGTYTERLADRRYETLAAAVSHALGQASREIVGELSGRSTAPAP